MVTKMSLMVARETKFGCMEFWNVFVFICPQAQEIEAGSRRLMTAIDSQTENKEMPTSGRHSQRPHEDATMGMTNAK